MTLKRIFLPGILPGILPKNARLTEHIALAMNNYHYFLAKCITERKVEELVKRIRLTNQRQVLIEELRKVTTHPTAGELFDVVRQRLPRIGLGTVYRNLDLLAECGFIRKIETGGEQKRFDGNTGPHYHIRCNTCGRVDDMLIPRLEDLDAQAADSCSYTILGHHIEFSGICADCNNSREHEAVF